MNTISHTVKAGLQGRVDVRLGPGPAAPAAAPRPPEEIPTDIYLTRERFDRLTVIEQA